MTSTVKDAFELSYQSLREGLALSLLDDACLALRAPRYASCRACENTCPVKALRVETTAIDLADTCVRCGRCAGACPMGALALPGFSVPHAAPESKQPLRIECWKVPAQLSSADAVRVPCLGGLSAGRILELVARADTGPVQLMDRGWCRGCSAGGKAAHPVQGNLDQARSLLQAAGVQTERLPRLHRDPLPAHLMPSEIPASVTETKLGRRGFFSVLGAKTASVAKVNAAAPARKRRGFEKAPIPSRERERLLLGTALAGQASGATPPRELFFRVEVSPACGNHQLCASICPTGALAVFDQDRRTELRFDTRLCIGCQECSAICPSGALNVLPNGDANRADVLPDHPIRLTSFEERSCPECARFYTAKALNDDLCPQCHKRRQLASSAFESLFGPRR